MGLPKVGHRGSKAAAVLLQGNFGVAAYFSKEWIKASEAVSTATRLGEQLRVRRRRRSASPTEHGLRGLRSNDWNSMSIVVDVIFCSKYPPTNFPWKLKTSVRFSNCVLLMVCWWTIGAYVCSTSIWMCSSECMKKRTFSG